MSHGRLWLRIVVLAAVLAAGRAVPARAQSLTLGALSGVAVDSGGAPLREVQVSLVNRLTGVSRAVQTNRTGIFRFTLLAPGEYDVLVERFGFIPVRLQRVPVRAGAARTVSVTLAFGTGPVDSLAFRGAPMGALALSLADGGSADDFAALADPLMLITSTGEILPMGDGGLEGDGLPGGRFGMIGVDAMSRAAARHGGIPGASLDGLVFPLGAVREAEPMTLAFDTEWQTASSGSLGTFTVPGPRELTFHASVEGGPQGQYGLFTVAGPLARDTAHFSVGIAARRLSPEGAAPWGTDSSALRVAALAQDSFATDLSAYTRAYQPSAMIISGFGRLDWMLGGNHRVAARVEVATGQFDDPPLGPVQPPVLGAELATRDLSIGAALASRLSEKWGNELRATVDAGQRRYDAPADAGTLLLDGGLSAGTSQLQPGSFKRTTLQLRETVHLLAGVWSIKGGLAFATDNHNREYAANRAGTFVFSDTLRMAQRNGAFTQVVGTPPIANFQTSTTSLFVQALARPSDAVELFAGLRFDNQKLPASEITPNSSWQVTTGLDNAAVPTSVSGVAPRFAFRWALGRSRSWSLQGGAGIYNDPEDPELLAEAIVHSVGAQVRRGVGTLSDWPQAPDSASAPVRGATVTMLGENHRAPKTGRVALSLGGNLLGSVMRLTGTYRHTDYLPVRRDLNLFTTPSSSDQYGRPVYGTLTQSGALLAAVPGTNRRFAAFDAVPVLDPAGASDFWGMSISMQRDVARGLSLMAHYAYSKTEDNWVGARSGLPDAQYVPFADSTGHSEWAIGVSDFDVPHRLTLGAEIRMPGRAGVRLALLYRQRSGYAFTPGFRAGVDANGDGSDRNDPAFVTDTVQGASALISASDCLRAQIGRFAARNSCREPDASALDLRLGVVLTSRGALRTELVVDALGVVREGGDLIDRALYLVDGTRAIATNPATRVTNVPLVANPNFGKPLVRRGGDVLFRAGIKVTF